MGLCLFGASMCSECLFMVLQGTGKVIRFKDAQGFVGSLLKLLFG